MIRIRTKRLYVEIDRHAEKDEKCVRVQHSGRKWGTHLVVKGYVIDFGDAASLELLRDDRPDKHAPPQAV